MSKKIHKVKQDATRFFSKGKWDKALKAYYALTKLDPKDPKNFQKVAELQIKLGMKEEAVDSYKEALEVYMKRGFLIQAIAIGKIIVKMDPSQDEIEERLAELYHQRGVGGALPKKRVATPPKPKPPATKPEPEPEPIPIENDEEAPAMDLSDEVGAEPELPPAGEGEASLEDLPDLPPLDASEGQPQLINDPHALPPLDEDMAPDIIAAPGDVDQLPPIENIPEEIEDKPQPKAYDLSAEMEDDSGGVEIDVMGGSEEPAPGPESEDIPIEEEIPIDAASPMEEDIPIDEEEAPPEPPVYDLSAEMEEGDEPELATDLEEEWEEEAEELMETPPSGAELLKGEDFLDEADIEDIGLFPEIPLFKDLGKEEFQRVVHKLESLSFKKGECLLKEGDDGDSILILASGQALAYKHDDKGGKIELGVLKEGEFFGEFGYFAGHKRQASVEALEDVEALEISRENMDSVIDEFSSVEDVLERFFKERVMQNILATNVLFRELELADRKEIAQKFKLIEVREDEDIVVEGDEGDSMYLIRSGDVTVHTTNPMGDKVHLAQLSAGDFFGEVSLIQGKPRTATVSAASPVVELMQLDKNDLDEIIEFHPEILDKLNEIIEARMEETVNKVSILDLDEEGLDLGSLL